MPRKGAWNENEYHESEVLEVLPQKATRNAKGEIVVPVLPFVRADVVKILEARNIKPLNRNEMTAWYDALERYGYLNADEAEHALDEHNSGKVTRKGVYTAGEISRPPHRFRPFRPVEISISVYVVGEYADKNRGTNSRIDVDYKTIRLDRFDDFGEFGERLLASVKRAIARSPQLSGLEGDAEPHFAWSIEHFEELLQTLQKRGEKL